MRKFSIIIPVYNRPQELDELLATLTLQNYSSFEVLVIDDGSTVLSDEVVHKYEQQLNIKYFYKENSGQGFTRNFGFEKSTGDYFIILDSDVLVPENYLTIVNEAIDKDGLDAFGGPDKEHPSFTPVQKAISYAMTSLYTTGGIRGHQKRLAAFHPRSFNMGLSREVYSRCCGFIITRMAEDLEFSIRIIEAGFKVGLIPEAYVFHKRRTSFSQFFKQLMFFGRGRINVWRYFPQELKIVHTFPVFFLLAFLIMLVMPFINLTLFLLIFMAFLIYFVLIIVDSYKKFRDLKLAGMCVLASFIQLTAYGIGFIYESFLHIFGKKIV